MDQQAVATTNGTERARPRSADAVPATAKSPGIKRQNWKGEITYYAGVVEVAESVDDIVRIMKNRDRYPSPVRAAGSHHSETHCIDANGGTVIDVTRMNKIIAIDKQAMTITMQAGVLHIDAAKRLEQEGLQFNVNVEIGNMTVGSAACCGTKESAFPGGYGQVNSYVVGAKLVLASGELLEVTEQQPELLRAVRSSYGMMGVLYEVTFKVRPHKAMKVYHVAYSVDDFANRLQELIGQNKSMMLYMFPFIGKVVVEYREYVEGKVTSHWQWWLRNFVWSKFAPFYAALLTKILPRAIRNFFLNCFGRLNVVTLAWLVKGGHTSPTDQIIRYPKKGTGMAAYTFSIWTFPESEYPQSIRAYFKFCQDYAKQRGFRHNLLSVGYRVPQDTHSLFSYTAKGPAMTLDPVSTGDAGWEEFLDAYNEWSIQHNGVPLFNQSPRLTPAQAKQALGPQIKEFQEIRRRYDPTDRLYTEWFRGLFE